MSDESTEQQTDGALLQGSDGSVYFIPNDRMSEFRVADEDATGVREALDSIDGEVTGFSQSVLPLKDGIMSLKAFSGPIGIKRQGVIAPDTAGDGIWGG